MTSVRSAVSNACLSSIPGISLPSLHSAALLDSRPRRSYDAEDLDCVKQQRRLSKLITEKVQALLKNSKDEIFQAIKEKDETISVLREELSAVANHGVHQRDPNVTVSRKLAVRGLDPGGEGFRSERKPPSHLQLRLAAKSTTASKTAPRVEPDKDRHRFGNFGVLSKRNLFAQKRPAKDDDERGDKRVPPAAPAAVSREDVAAAHLQRLTEEHARLQAEYARVRTALQIARVRPMPAAMTASSDALDIDPGALQTSLAHLDLNGIGEDALEGADRAGFRREVLRLKEELLTAHQKGTEQVGRMSRRLFHKHPQCVLQKMNSYLESKTAAVEELRQLRQDFQSKESDLCGRLAKKEDKEKDLRNIVLTLQRKVHVVEDSNAELRARLKETEREATEMKEYLQEEHRSLSEALGEAEERFERCRAADELLQQQLKNREDHCDVLSQVVTETQARVNLLETELKDTQDGARTLLLQQGEELNSCSVAVRELLGVIKDLDSKAPNTLVQAILEAVDGDGDSITSGGAKESTGCGLLSQIKAVHHGVELVGQNVKFLVASLERAVVERNTLEENLSNVQRKVGKLESQLEASAKEQVKLQQKNEYLKGVLDEVQAKLKESWCNVNERVDSKLQVEELREQLTKALRCNMQSKIENEELAKQMEDLAGGGGSKPVTNLEDLVTLRRQITSLRQQLLDRDQKLEDAVAKHERHGRVLRENLGRAEAEIRRLDAVLDKVFVMLGKVPEVVQSCDDLRQLWQDLTGKDFVVVADSETNKTF